MRKLFTLFIVISMGVFTPSVVKAQNLIEVTLAEWNFNWLTSGSIMTTEMKKQPISPDLGLQKATAQMATENIASRGWSPPSGGLYMYITNWFPNTNEKGFYFSGLNTVDCTSITLSSRNSSDGANDAEMTRYTMKIQYRADGGDWTDVPGSEFVNRSRKGLNNAGNDGSYYPQTVSLTDNTPAEPLAFPVGAEGKEALEFRYLLVNEAHPDGDAAIKANPQIRIDDIVLKAKMPEDKVSSAIKLDDENGVSIGRTERGIKIIATQLSPVIVYSVTGIKVAEVSSCETNPEIALEKGCVYIVKVGTLCRKVAL